MLAKYVLSVLAVVFLGCAALSLRRPRGPAARAWLLVGAIFAAVSVWLWFGG